MAKLVHGHPCQEELWRDINSTFDDPIKGLRNEAVAECSCGLIWQWRTISEHWWGWEKVGSVGCHRSHFAEDVGC